MPAFQLPTQLHAWTRRVLDGAPKRSPMRSVRVMLGDSSSEESSSSSSSSSEDSGSGALDVMKVCFFLVGVELPGLMGCF
jgi:hypothetical protein